MDGPLSPDHLARVDVSQRPVVDAGLLEIGDAARRVGVVVGVAADVGVKQPNVEPAAGKITEVGRQVLAHLTPRVAYPVHRGPRGVVRKHRRSRDLRPEAHTAGGQVQPGLPAVQRVVVAVADERAYAGGVQSPQPVDELQLRTQAAVGAVVHVARHQQRVHPLLDAQLHDPVVHIEGRAAQRAAHLVRRYRPQSGERAVEVKVGGVYESELGHGLPVQSGRCDSRTVRPQAAPGRAESDWAAGGGIMSHRLPGRN